MQLDVTCHHHLPTDTCPPVQSRGECVKRKITKRASTAVYESWISHIGETHKICDGLQCQTTPFCWILITKIRNVSTATKIHVSLKIYISCLYLLHLTMTNVLIFISMNIKYIPDSDNNLKIILNINLCIIPRHLGKRYYSNFSILIDNNYLIYLETTWFCPKKSRTTRSTAETPNLCTTIPFKVVIICQFCPSRNILLCKYTNPYLS